MREEFGDEVVNLVIEQLQSDEESTDSENNDAENSSKLNVIRPLWRSQRVIYNNNKRYGNKTDIAVFQGVQAFAKFNEYDAQMRSTAGKEKESRRVGRYKQVVIKGKYLEKAPVWSKA